MFEANYGTITTELLETMFAFESGDYKTFGANLGKIMMMLNNTEKKQELFLY